MTRPSARRRGYTTKWDQARAAFLRAHRCCAFCGKPATVVDHVIPHRGDMRAFWDKANWSPLCSSCHDSAKRREEQGGTRGPVRGCDTNGIPLEPAVRKRWEPVSYA
jgi:5-methylcytosine-specific restriction endonuclease McrA